MQLTACIWASEVHALLKCADALLEQNPPPQSFCVACLPGLTAEDASAALKKHGIFTSPPPKACPNIESAKNFLLDCASSEWLLFIDARLLPEKDFLTQLYKAAKLHPDAVALECRQLPCEQQHPIDPASLKTPTAETSLLAVRQAALLSAGGFDTHFTGLWADRDLSLRLRALGDIYFVPAAAAFWQTEQPGTADTLAVYADDVMGRLLFACKYCSFKNRISAKKSYRGQIRAPKHFAGVRKALLKNYILRFTRTLPIWWWRITHSVMQKTAQTKYSPNDFAQRGRAVLNKRISEAPSISVIIRTAGRPQVLEGALRSLTHQTCPPHEIIVVEDGPNTSEEMLRTNFSSLPIRYHSTKEHVGRGRAGNLGMQMATGEYLNLLDDDDYFYPDHLELMADAAIQYPHTDLILGCAMAMEIENGHTEKLYSMRFDRLNIFTMSQQCQIPIQSALFKKSLFIEYGGLREDMEGNEDWAMWMRFLMHAKRPHSSKADLDRATSVFVQPADTQAKALRLARYKEFNHTLFSDTSLSYTLTMQDLRTFYDDMIADILHLRKHGLLDEYLDREKNRNQ